jgi:nitrite reductase/ring-hydroxylating ferredoxin subunit
MSAPHGLCALAALPEGQAALIEAPGGLLEDALVLVRRGQRVDGYVNKCPHMGFSLDWKTERIVIGDGKFLRCVHHGAVFRVEDGVCVAGPCLDESLTKVALEIVDGEVRLSAEATCNA